MMRSLLLHDSTNDERGDEVDFNYHDWLAEQRMEAEMRKAEEIDDAHHDPDGWQESRIQDRYEAGFHRRDDVG